ncbi:MAG TPA: adenylate/guanylate cyclase domain-containing response regulator [Chloroflexi bacterium]|nr:adenylate/guanylate cyclase domain-containing response regulator [Chloroflexota bacterium]
MGARLVLADDNEAFLEATARLLERQGYEVFAATSGDEALRHLSQHRPEAILLDIMMPGIDGLAVLEKIRQQDPLLGVVMITAFGSEEIAVKALTAGADDYLIKPLDYEEAFIRLERVLDRTRLRRERLRLEQELAEAHSQLQQRYQELEASYGRIRELEEQTRELFERYLPPQVAQYLIDDPSRANLGGERREVTILFADLRGFTALAEKMSPERLVEVINGYLSLAAECVVAQGGVLDKFMGDSVMALYNSPLEQPDHALRALKTAFDVRDNVRLSSLQPALRFGFGINTGEAVVGNVGSEALMNYTAIGDPVNLAFRIQEQAKAEQILLSRATYDQVKDHVEAKPLGRMRMERRAEEAEVYEAVTLRAET